MFTFESAVGPCDGVVRLVPEGGPGSGTYKAWTLATLLAEIRGHEDPANGSRWQNVDWKRNFGGENWADRRKKAVEYADRDPAVLVVGAAQAGLMVAARLSMLGVDTLVIDREKRLVLLEGRAPIRFDVASVDVGIGSGLPELPGFDAHGVAAKPLGDYAQRW